MSIDEEKLEAPSFTLSFIVGEGEEGLRLDVFLVGRLRDSGASRSFVQQRLRTGDVVDKAGAVAGDSSRRVLLGEAYSVHLPERVEAKLEPEVMDLLIRHEDEAVLVLEKPAGLVVHPGAGRERGTLAAGLLAHCGAGLAQVGSAARPGIVHRLDMDTSGLMVIAKTQRAYHNLQGQFAAHGRDGALERGYLAMVRGCPKAVAGKIEVALGRSSRDRKKMAVRRDGRAAATSWRFERKLGKGAALLSCRLHTGRTHQVRVHLAHLGHPVLGDKLYGAGAAGLGDAPRQALHAVYLSFLHPQTGERMSFRSALPEDMELLAARLELC